MASDEIATAIDGMDYWATRWKEGRTGWHLDKVNQTLIKFLDQLTKDSDPKKFFLPLCGQTYDIKFLYGLGHKIFAIEGVKEVIEGLNERDQLKLQFNPEESIFVSPDGRIVIYVGDILDCPVEKWGPVDCIWDRGSLIAVNYIQRRSYIDIIRRIVKKSEDEYCDFCILLEVVCYPKELYPGPPRSVDEADMKELYSDWTEIETLEKTSAETSFPVLRNRIVGEHEANVLIYLLTPK